MFVIDFTLPSAGITIPAFCIYRYPKINSFKEERMSMIKRNLNKLLEMILDLRKEKAVAISGLDCC